MAQTYRFTDIILNCSRILMSNASLTRNEREYAEYAAITEKALQDIQHEIRAEELYQRLSINFASAAYGDADMGKAAEQSLSEVNAICKKCDSYQLHYLRFQIWISKAQIHANFQEVIQVCEMAEKYLQDNPNFNQNEDRGDHGEQAVAAVTARDVVICISASSVTPFVRAALSKARSRKARTVLVTCAPQTRLKSLADVVIAIRTGPEVLTGSTRLKAGSATKAVLNAITTAAMVRVGKAYTNFMVDLKQTSKKLEDRARRIVAMSADVDLAEADRLVRAADNEVKTAIVMGLLRVDAPTARMRLAKGEGHVRKAINGSRRP